MECDLKLNICTDSLQIYPLPTAVYTASTTTLNLPLLGLLTAPC